jgi:hypothetical protein
MAALRRLVLVAVAATVGSLLIAVTSPPASSRSVDDRCVGNAPLPVSAIERGAAPAGCSLVGRVIFTRHVGVVVPPPGMSVSGDGLSRHGEVDGLTVTNTGARVIAVRGSAHEGARYLNPPAKLGAYVARLGGSPPACRDRAFNLEHHHWVTPLRWRDNLSRAPARLDKSVVVHQIRQANTNMRTGRNTCGKPRLRTPPAHYAGRTTAQPNIKTSPQQVTCGRYNTHNVVGFGNLPGDLLGWTCFWWVGHGRMAAADVMMDNGPGLVTQVPPGCFNRWDFEGAVTHEFGHVYGLAHTGSGHDNLTMQHALRPCSPYARTLGLGDWLGMKKMYGAR